jgi:hypothetical protein
MSRVLGATFQRPHDHGFDQGIVNRTWRPGTRLVMQPVQPPLHKMRPPLAYRRPVQTQLLRHFLVLTAFRARQHDPGSQSQRQRRLPLHHQRLQFGTLIIAQCQGGKLLDRHQTLRRCCSLHPWDGDANLLRIYDCEFVTRDTSLNPALSLKSRNRQLNC